MSSTTEVLGKTCSRCSVEKPLDAFAKGRQNGTHVWCRSCQKDYRAGRERADRNARYLRTYGITADHYDLLHEKQQGVCAICGLPETAMQGDRVKLLAVDHCHDTGEVRGLLCVDCNRGVGIFGDSPVRLRAAAAYLEAKR